MPAMPANSPVSKLMSARPRLGATLATAPTTPFTPEMMAAVRGKVSPAAQGKKKKGPVANALATLSGEF